MNLFVYSEAREIPMRRHATELMIQLSMLKVTNTLKIILV